MTFNGLACSWLFGLVPVIIWRKKTAGRVREEGKLP